MWNGVDEGNTTWASAAYFSSRCRCLLRILILLSPVTSPCPRQTLYPLGRLSLFYSNFQQCQHMASCVVFHNEDTSLSSIPCSLIFTSPSVDLMIPTSILLVSTSCLLDATRVLFSSSAVLSQFMAVAVAPLNKAAIWLICSAPATHASTHQSIYLISSPDASFIPSFVSLICL